MSRVSSPSSAIACVVAFSVGLCVPRAAHAKPKDTSKNAEALRLDKKALTASVSGDVPGAIKMLEQAVHLCEPANACTVKTKTDLHVDLGTLRGVGAHDYAAAKREFIIALALDPQAHLRALSTPELTTAFEDARTATAPTKTPDKPTDPPPPDKPVSVGDLFPQEEPPPSNEPPPKKEPAPTKLAPPPPGPRSPPRRLDWLSLRLMGDFAYLTDANVCSPGAPSNYYCTFQGARYTGHPQPNSVVSKGFAYSTTRLVLGYERLLYAGLTAGVFAGYALRLAPEANGRKAFFPLHLEGRATYTFGAAPYEDEGDRFNPFVFVSLGVAQVDTHVVIRVNEIPCESQILPACKRDLDVFRTVGDGFATLGGGLRVRVVGNQALRAAVRATVMIGDGGFVFSPEVAYELGF
jgi:hypothetical protein